SFENVDLPLIRKAAGTGKPLIISTGMATLAELDEAVRTARQAGCKDLALLKCTSSYPAPPQESNLFTIPYMQSIFSCEVGLSDHTQGIGSALAAVALGACLIEKHFTRNRADGGLDAAFSLEPQEMQDLVQESRRAWQALGKVDFAPAKSEAPARSYRRSLYICRDMQAGEALDEQSLRRVRPGLGLSAKYYEVLLGKRLARDVKKGTPMSWDLLE
ncbi:MAG: N-acetylneuraminate synthase family protein, partial [Desulfohalobiaceae bacterium]